MVDQLDRQCTGQNVDSVANAAVIHFEIARLHLHFQIPPTSPQTHGSGISTTPNLHANDVLNASQNPITTIDAATYGNIRAIKNTTWHITRLFQTNISARPAEVPRRTFFMHCVCLAELAAILSGNASSILSTDDGISPPALAAYWTATRTRMDLWHRCLARHRDAADHGDHDDVSRWWKQHRGVAEEIIVGELLCRVMAALASDLDARRAVDECSPVAHAVYLAHLDVSNRLQRILLTRGPSVADTVRINRLRHAVGRWIDTMVGRMTHPDSAAIGYAVDCVRAKRFSNELASLRGDDKASLDLTVEPVAAVGALLMNASMVDLLRRCTDPHPSLPASNVAVARSVLLLLKPRWFAHVDQIRSTQLGSMTLAESHHETGDASSTGPSSGYVWNESFYPSNWDSVIQTGPKQHRLGNRWTDH